MLDALLGLFGSEKAPNPLQHQLTDADLERMDFEAAKIGNKRKRDVIAKIRARRRPAAPIEQELIAPAQPRQTIGGFIEAGTDARQQLLDALLTPPQ